MWPQASGLDDEAKTKFVGQFRPDFYAFSVALLTMFFQLNLRFQPSDAKVAEVNAAFAAFARRANMLPGCIGANLYHDQQHTSSLLFTEEWVSQAKMEAHLKSESFRRMCQFAEGCAERVEIEIHQSFPVGDLVDS